MDPDRLSDSDILAVPAANIPPGLLVRIWTRKAGLIQQANIDELAAERNGSSTSHRMIGATAETEAEREDREHRQAVEYYERAMQDIRDRADRLLARIEEQQRDIDRRREEIDDKAIRLHDGRKAYVDGTTYRDEQGRELRGGDADEAAGKDNGHQSTWSEKQEIEHRWEETTRLKARVLRARDNATASNADLDDAQRTQSGREAQAAMNRAEQDFGSAVDARIKQNPKAEDYADADLTDVGSIVKNKILTNRI